MINGFVSSMSLWDPLMIETLAKQHKVVIFDNRGVGLSTDTEKNNTTIPQMADDAAELIKALGFKKAHILAFSMGARIGQQLLIRHPDLVNKAVLCDPPIRAENTMTRRRLMSKPSSTIPTRPRWKESR